MNGYRWIDKALPSASSLTKCAQWPGAGTLMLGIVNSISISYVGGRNPTTWASPLSVLAGRWVGSQSWESSPNTLTGDEGILVHVLIARPNTCPSIPVFKGKKQKQKQKLVAEQHLLFSEQIGVDQLLSIPTTPWHILSTEALSPGSHSSSHLPGSEGF